MNCEYSGENSGIYLIHGCNDIGWDVKALGRLSKTFLVGGLIQAVCFALVCAEERENPLDPDFVIDLFDLNFVVVADVQLLGKNFSQLCTLA